MVCVALGRPARTSRAEARGLDMARPIRKSARQTLSFAREPKKGRKGGKKKKRTRCGCVCVVEWGINGRKHWSLTLRFSPEHSPVVTMSEAHTSVQGSSDAESQQKRLDPHADDFRHGFWDREVAPLRKVYLLGILRVTIAISLLIWGVVTM